MPIARDRFLRIQITSDAELSYLTGQVLRHLNRSMKNALKDSMAFADNKLNAEDFEADRCQAWTFLCKKCEKLPDH